MGQLFNRISRFVKSEIDDRKVTSDKLIDESDEELKRIIDELERENNGQKKDHYNSEYAKSNDNPETRNFISTDEAYLILGLTSKASNDEIKSGYKQKMKEYHPDRVASLGAELRQLAEKKTQEINKAYELLKKSRGFN
ncbi:MAG: DnaJ domain-containing protein [Ignavibacteriae bacterium]|nr:DnaJ domain-containing protein [Ignavibacteriota bacterium]